MRLNELQLKALKRYWSYHKDNYHSSMLVVANWPIWILTVLGCGFCYWATKIDRYEWWGWMGFGFFIGYAALVVRSIGIFSKIWPALEEAINWERVDALLKENDPRHPGN